MHRAWVGIASLLVAACGGTPEAVDAGRDASAPPDAGVDAGPVAVHALSGVDPTLPYADLAPLAGIIGDAEVVGIGESVHTTGGEARMRARLIRYLVEELGFRAIAIEGSRTGIEDVLAPYLASCTGSPEDAALAFNPIWWDTSTPALLAWLCEWNDAHPSDHVTAFGFDIRQPWTTHPALRAYLDSVAPADAATIADGLSSCLGVGYADEMAFFEDPVVRDYFGGITPMPAAPHDECQAGATAALEYFAAQRDALIGASSERDFELARLSVVEMQALDESIYHVSRRDLAAANPLRDIAMADGFETLRRLDHPDARVVVWAHNGHLMSRSDEVTAGQWMGVPNMITLLESRGAIEGYVAIGQLSFLAHIDWMAGRQTITNAEEWRLEPVIDGLGVPLALIDVPAAEAQAPPLWDPALDWGISFDRMYPSRHYRALVFHHESEANEYFALPPWHVP